MPSTPWRAGSRSRAVVRRRREARGHGIAVVVRDDGASLRGHANLAHQAAARGGACWETIGE